MEKQNEKGQVIVENQMNVAKKSNGTEETPWMIAAATDQRAVTL